MKYVYLCFVDEQVDDVSCIYAAKDTALKHGISYLKSKFPGLIEGSLRLDKGDDVFGWWRYTMYDEVEIYDFASYGSEAEVCDIIKRKHGILITRKPIIEN